MFLRVSAVASPVASPSSLDKLWYIPAYRQRLLFCLSAPQFCQREKASVAWNLSGTAYRMVVDLGCHMMLGPDYEEVKSQSSSQMIHKDIEQE